MKKDEDDRFFVLQPVVLSTSDVLGYVLRVGVPTEQIKCTTQHTFSVFHVLNDFIANSGGKFCPASIATRV